MLVNRKLASDFNYLTKVNQILAALHEVRKNISVFRKDDERPWKQRFVPKNRTILENAAEFFDLKVPNSLSQFDEFISYIEKIKHSTQRTYDDERTRIVKRYAISPTLALFALRTHIEDKNEKKLSFGL